MAASTLLGVALVALVALATVAVATLVWARAEDRARLDNDRTAQAAREALQTSLGRVLATLRGADGLVDERGVVDVTSFQAFARGISVIPGAETFAYEEIVSANERPSFEARTGLGIREFVRPGVYRTARDRASYLPVVSVWPPTAANTRLLGVDLQSEPVRRTTTARAAARREAAFTELITLAGGQPGVLAFKPLYAPEERNGAPIGFVSTSFTTQAIADALGGLPSDARLRVMVGQRPVYESADPPAGGETRSLVLGGRRWTVTALSDTPSRTAPAAILLGGLGLAALLAAFIWSRASFERRLVRANRAEREARERAELMERNAGHLAAASTAVDVARTAVESFQASGADVVYVWRLRDAETLEELASTSLPEATHRRFSVYPLERAGLVTDALRAGALAAIGTREEYDARFPALAEERHHLGFETVAAAPLRAANGEIVGALFIASRTRHWLSDSRRQLLLAVAEQMGVALERSVLFEAEREARRIAELLERNAARLAAAVTIDDVAGATVNDLGEAGLGHACVQVLGARGIEELASTGVASVGPPSEEQRGYRLESRSVSAEVVRTGVRVEVATARELDDRYPDSAERRARLGAETMLAVPLRAGDRRVIGVLEVSAPEPHWVTPTRRQVIVGVAELCGLALERAQLQREATKTAETAAFVANLADALERSTTVSTRARRLTELLTDDRATFAAVHLREEGPPVVVAVSGSRPLEIRDDDEWLRHVTQAIDTGRPVHPQAEVSDADMARGDSPLVILPLRARGHVIGALTLRSAADARWEPAFSPAFAREIAQRAAVRIDNALLYERERDVSHSLQLGLLGGSLPAFEGVVVTAAYRAGTEALEVGGDWYDAIPLPSGAIGLVVGDVVGHGLEAAVAMGQLRGAVGALAQTAPPAVLLELLDRFVENVPSAATATLAYVEFDRETGAIRYACAGHPPPLVVAADGSTRYLWDGRSAPLGSILGEARGDAADVLGDGEALILYTDGLVERRTESIDVGLERLAAAAASYPRSEPGLADDISDGLLEGRSQDDDVCVLTLYRLPVSRLFSHSFVASPSELAGLRERLRSWLEAVDVDPETMRSTVLAVSEAAANAVEHGYGCDGRGIVGVSARRTVGDEIEVTVRDEGTWRASSDRPDRGRGLPIIEAIVDEVSIDRENGATVVRMRRTPRHQISA